MRIFYKNLLFLRIERFFWSHCSHIDDLKVGNIFGDVHSLTRKFMIVLGVSFFFFLHYTHLRDIIFKIA